MIKLAATIVILTLVSMFIVIDGACSLDAEPTQPPEGLCQCAVFKSESPPADEAPLLAQKPGVKLPCSAEGAKTCQDLCLALAQAAKGRGPAIICDIVKHVDLLLVSVFSRVCDEPTWSYTGVTSKDPFCCHDGAPKACPGYTLSIGEDGEPIFAPDAASSSPQ